MVIKAWQAVKSYFGLGPHGLGHPDPREDSDIPWASFEIEGFEDDGRIAIKFNWNDAFIKKIKDLGFEAETEEDTVQLFFYTSSMRPTSLAADPEDDAVQSDGHPQLSKVTNEIRVG